MRAILTCCVALLCVVAGLGVAAAAGIGQPMGQTPFLAPDPLSVHPVSMTANSSGETCQACQDDCGACACCQAGCRRCGRADRSCCIGSTCDMGQRYPYFPPMHGYYYFRPYHPSHVRTHQALVQTWGEDPANPYANQIFKTVYAEYKAEGQAPTAPAAK